MKPPNPALFDERNSLLYWFPKVRALGIPVPKTEWVEFPPGITHKFFDESTHADALKQFRPYLKKLAKKAEALGYPVFIKTDMASHKHGWEKGAFVRRKKQLLDHIIDTLEFNEMVGFVGLNYRAIVVREFLELDWRFKAFYGNMPVARERRYFINDSQVLCHHAYWIKDAILKAHKDEGKTHGLFGYIPHKLPNKWEEMLEEINRETEEEITLLTHYASKIAEVFTDYWSIDFAYTRKGEWVLIDMANGYASEHPACNKKLIYEKGEPT